MGYLSEKAAYLKGLAEGMKLEEKNDEGKMICRIIEALEEFASSIDEINDVVEECEERIDDLDEFATELSDCFSDCCDDDCDCGCDDDDCDCDCCGDFDDDDLEDVEFYEVRCPHCDEKVYFDEDMIDAGDLNCPNCGKIIEIEIEG